MCISTYIKYYILESCTNEMCIRTYIKYYIMLNLIGVHARDFLFERVTGSEF